MSKLQRVASIDFLRGLSCLGILLYHVRVDLWVGWRELSNFPESYTAFERAVAWLSVPAPFLGHAILLFFLISGFCIHYPQTNGSTPNWNSYLLRRFFRIYPPYFVAVALTVAITYLCHLLWNDETWDPSRIWRVLSLTQNYPPGKGQLLSNPSLWTIPLEMEFYVLYPLAFIFFFKLKSSLLWIVTGFLSALSVYLSSQGVAWTSFTALFFWPVWLLGAWTAQLYHDNRLQSLSYWKVVPVLSLSLALSLASRLQGWDAWIQYLLWTCFYLCLLFLSLSWRNPSSNSVLRALYHLLSWLGKISFSVYLVHFPLFKLFGYLHISIFAEKPANFIVSLGYLFLVCPLGWLFYLCVERPVHFWSRNRIRAK